MFTDVSIHFTERIVTRCVNVPMIPVTLCLVVIIPVKQVRTFQQYSQFIYKLMLILIKTEES